MLQRIPRRNGKRRISPRRFKRGGRSVDRRQVRLEPLECRHLLACEITGEFFPPNGTSHEFDLTIENGIQFGSLCRITRNSAQAADQSSFKFEATVKNDPFTIGMSTHARFDLMITDEVDANRGTGSSEQLTDNNLDEVPITIDVGLTSRTENYELTLGLTRENNDCSEMTVDSLSHKHI